MIRLGVNVDHVATLRQARRGREPDPVAAAHECELGGADQLTIHLREDRRHIQDRDLRILRQTAQVPLNLELGLGEDVLGVALEVRPDVVTLVPERRQEVTTEGGLDVVAGRAAVAEAVKRFHAVQVAVSLFIDPDPAQLEAARAVGVDRIEIHTGTFAHAFQDVRAPAKLDRELARLLQAAELARVLELHLALGHGLDYRNISLVTNLPGLEEVNIGHSIVSRAVFTGLREAVREMKRLLV